MATTKKPSSKKPATKKSTKPAPHIEITVSVKLAGKKAFEYILEGGEQSVVPGAEQGIQGLIEQMAQQVAQRSVLAYGQANAVQARKNSYVAARNKRKG